MIKILPISGFYENLPEEQIIEDEFKDILKKNYNLSGFVSLDTPNIERVEILTSKGADDNEIYGIKRLKAEGKEKDNFEMGLRFDLTVPLAKYVAKYEGEINFPFKRQHIGRVYRGERPQKGRFREFYQADIDIIGNGKIPLFADVEILSTIYNSLKELSFGGFEININNKKLLSGFLEFLGVEKIKETISIIDKKNKVKREKLITMFESNNLNKEKIFKIIELIDLSEDNSKTNIEILSFFEQIDNKLLKEGLEELKYVYNNLLILGLSEKYIKINPAISRGLNYYTGLIFETFIKGSESMGSISSGGRYDNLCSHFSKNNFPGVGGSIGLSRLIAVLKELNLIKYNKKTVTKILVLNIDKILLKENLKIVKNLRKEGINTEIYLDDSSKFDKQLKYAFNKKIKYIITMGKEEYKKGIFTLKNLKDGTQKKLKINQLKKQYLFND